MPSMLKMCGSYSQRPGTESYVEIGSSNASYPKQNNCRTFSEESFNPRFVGWLPEKFERLYVITGQGVPQNPFFKAFPLKISLHDLSYHISRQIWRQNRTLLSRLDACCQHHSLPGIWTFSHPSFCVISLADWAAPLHPPHWQTLHHATLCWQLPCLLAHPQSPAFPPNCSRCSGCSLTSLHRYRCTASHVTYGARA